MALQDGSDDGIEEIRLKVVVFFDLVDSSRLMSSRESATIRFLQDAFAIFRTASERTGGEIIKTTGDGALILFDSATAALEFASEVHKAVTSIESGLEGTLAFRAGAHVGEIFPRDGDVYGHAVNLAARLQTVADSGQTCVSSDVHSLVSRHSRFTFEALGGRRLKNIPELTVVYLVRETAAEDAQRALRRLTVVTVGGPGLRPHAPSPMRPAFDIRLAPLGYLALSTQETESLGRLCALFRPDLPEAEARRSISRVFRQIADRFGDILLRGAGSVGLSREVVDVDLEDLENRIRTGQVDHLLLRSGDWPDYILAGTDDIGPSYAGWLQVTRTEWRLRIAQALETCLDRFQPQDTEMRDAATALLRLEPGHERAARVLIRHYRAADNPGAAVRVYDALSETLHRRFGIKPKPETLAALRDVAPAAGREQPGPVQQMLRIQVMPFASPDDDSAELLKSLRTQILASLACFRGWIVAEGEQPDDRGGKDGDYRLQATVNRLGARRAIALSLTKSESGRVIWSDTVALRSDRIQAVQRLAVARIAAALEVYLTTDRTRSSRDDPTLGIVDEWLRAERLFMRWTPPAQAEAAECYRALIAKAPDYAPPYASLAAMQNVQHIVRPGQPRDSAAGREAYELAERATELDPLDARNQLAVAWSASLAGDFDKASLHMEMAARLNPDSPRTLISCAMGFAFFGEHDRARAALDHSLTCSPLLLGYQWCYAASVYFLSGDLEAALTAVNRGRDHIIDNPGWHAAILTRMGRHDEADDAFRRLLAAVRPAWYGAGEATAEAVYAWFTGAYPIRRLQERRLLEFRGPPAG